MKEARLDDIVHAKFWEVPIVHVYIARFPFCVEEEKIAPLERAKEIEDCFNPNVRSEKYYAWKLLERALQHSLGFKIETLDIKRSANGKWECSSCFFSLSHSGNFVAVAVSGKPIGVDIEKWDESRFTEALENKIITEREGAKIYHLEESARRTASNALWTKKEAIFKLMGDKAFQPKRIETSEYDTITKAILCGDERYLITVASEDVEQAVFRCEGFELNDLNVLTI